MGGQTYTTMTPVRQQLDDAGRVLGADLLLDDERPVLRTVPEPPHGELRRLEALALPPRHAGAGAVVRHPLLRIPADDVIPRAPRLGSKKII